MENKGKINNQIPARGKIIEKGGCSPESRVLQLYSAAQAVWSG